MMILNGPLKETAGIRQRLDQIILADEPDEQTLAGVFEYLDFDLDGYRLTQKGQLTLREIKSIARQFLKALTNIHHANIVHTGQILFAQLKWLD